VIHYALINLDQTWHFLQQIGISFLNLGANFVNSFGNLRRCDGFAVNDCGTASKLWRISATSQRNSA
jgi:hypothetical protein